ncbi:MAG TPA: amino acid adenylation domain-containing protein, partial [Aquabacterium sp.]|uniref:non-ribosomal peptide synthetase n=1 Tax=Aquabacterium sp. TaxID=1872578 RepID=UPI002E34E036
ADGAIEYLGRTDHQVKIRGLRIELGEIEYHLTRQPEVKEAVVLAVRTSSPAAQGDQRLVAYVTPATAPSAPSPDIAFLQRVLPGQLRTVLRGVLPEHMVPNALVVLPTWPLSANGKLDRKALPLPDETAFVHHVYAPPDNELEAALASIWQDLLQAPQVGRFDNFFDLGGHSLLVIRMAERLRPMGWHVDMRTVFETRTLAELADALVRRDVSEPAVPVNLIPSECAHITPAMLPLISLSQAQIDRVVADTCGDARLVQDIYPLTPLQEGMLYHHVVALQSASGMGDAYIMPMLVRTASRAQLDTMLTAFQQVIDRHDALRTAVCWEGLPRPVQVVLRSATLPVDHLPLQGEDDVLACLQARMQPENLHMALNRAPLVRVETAQDGDAWYALVYLHHLVDDNYSLQRVLSELRLFMSAPHVALPPAVPYRGFVARVLAKAERSDAANFFTRYLAGVDEPTAPFGLLDVHGDGSASEEASLSISNRLSRSVTEQARRHGVATAAVFHAAWALVVAQASGRDDVVFGTVLSGRLHAGEGAAETVGAFINTLPLRLALQHCTARQAVMQVQGDLLSLSACEHAPLSLAQRCSDLPAGTPLFTAVLNFRHKQDDAPLDDLELAPGIELLSAQERSNYPLVMSIDEAGGQFKLKAQVPAHVGAKRLARMLETALTSMVAALAGTTDVSALSLKVWPDDELDLVLRRFNQTTEPLARGVRVPQLVTEWAMQQPDAAAIEMQGEILSYGELDQRANQWAHHLRHMGAGRGSIVALCLPRSPDLITGLLAILKSGAAYVPVDPSYPAARMAHMLQDSGAQFIVTDAGTAPSLPATEARLLLVDADATLLSACNTHTLEPGDGASDEDPAYVIYTSGSTGTPKGVMVSHAGLVNLARRQQASLGVTSQSRVLQFGSISFDASIWECLLAWGSGACLVLAHREDLLPGPALYGTLRDHAITHALLPPVAVSMMPSHDGLDALQVLCVGGEACPSGLAQRWARPEMGRRLVNLYGPTEATVCATSHECTPDEAGAVPIGKPLPNAQVYVLNARMQPVGVGVVGEIHIGGAGVALGYLHRPELTAERFVPDPFSPHGGRLYKTGDLARWTADGSLVYLGRNDQQVKLRGFRIELGEIQSHLLSLPSVREAVVLIEQDQAQQPRLVAYVTPAPTARGPDDDALRAEDLRAAMRVALPAYMVPSVFHVLDALPLTANGKLDKSRLPASLACSEDASAGDSPQGELEELLASIWRELLAAPAIQRHDNFFDLGGHSLLIVQMLDKLRAHGHVVDVRNVYAAADLADMAARIEAMGELVGPAVATVPANLIEVGCAAITPDMLPLATLSQAEVDHLAAQVPGGISNIQDIYPLVPLQAGMLFHRLLNPEAGDAYILPLVLEFDAHDRLQSFVSALQEVVNRHDVLRTAVYWSGLAKPMQVVWRQASLSLEQFEFSSAMQDGDTRREEFLSLMSMAHMRMDMGKAPLIRLVAGHIDADKWMLSLNVHHMVCDHVSLEVVLQEVQACMRGQSAMLPEVVPYRDFVWRSLQRGTDEEASRYFTQRLASVEQPCTLFDMADVHGGGQALQEARQPLKPEIALGLRAAARQLGVSPAAIVHVAWALVAGRCAGQSDVVFGSVLSGRMQGEASGHARAHQGLGVFVNTLPVRVDLRAQSPGELVRATQRDLVELIRFEQSSLAMAQRCSGVQGDEPLFNAVLNYRHSAAEQASLGQLDGVRVVASLERTNYPLSISVDDYGTGFGLSTQTRWPADAGRINAYMETALTSLTQALQAEPDGGHSPSLTQLEVLPAVEKRLLLDTFSVSGKRQVPELGMAPEVHQVHALFEAQARMRPDALAMRYGDQQWSYAQLDAQADGLAAYLQSLGVEADTLVAIVVDRGPQVILGLLASLKAGGAYVPVDASYPVERIAYMLGDARPAVILTSAQTHERVRALEAAAQAVVVNLDAVTPWHTSPATPLKPSNGHEAGRHLAYVIYTSGSTGQPKGVMVEHRGLCQLLAASVSVLALDEHSRVLQFASTSFDASAWEWMMALCVGGSLHLADQADVLPGPPLQQTLQRHGITHVLLSPAVMNAWPLGEAANSLRTLIAGGDACPAALARQYARGCRFVNAYGPTEASVCATLEICDPDELDKVDAGVAVSIGRPLGGAHIHILDKFGRPVPIGATGEIHIGGDGVARGYLHRPTLTAERFVPDPFSQDVDARLYKTGDLARWREDGRIDYLGRQDHQIKVRGFRIEPGEIEARLLAQPGVQEAAVLAVKAG